MLYRVFVRMHGTKTHCAWLFFCVFFSWFCFTSDCAGVCARVSVPMPLASPFTFSSLCCLFVFLQIQQRSRFCALSMCCHLIRFAYLLWTIHFWNVSSSCFCNKSDACVLSHSLLLLSVLYHFVLFCFYFALDRSLSLSFFFSFFCICKPIL